ncbi:Iron-sulfur cluster-binding protein [Methanosarcina barkeri 3]|uniref:Iron-sulfur cluster-binding protein n=1 Tax=Methanosarcina barkeri 3 TaxID=1434107 RepID=A0A0E3WVW8_METBA|nr:hypothetical protein [Methanosarcina barkeri]AKB80790.1 Iron-sulfur cluster-binding protein [Methanosarcina barkeri 3]
MTEDLKKALLQKCESMDIPMVGVTNVERGITLLFYHGCLKNSILSQYILKQNQ